MGFDTLEKGNRAHLVAKQVQVTKNGKTFTQTVYVNPEEKEGKTKVGENISEVSGMNIQKYSEKAVLITGDTYVNVDTLRSIKKEVGVGNWNRKLQGWVFPVKVLDTVLGFLWADQKDKGNDEKAQAIQNQKNESLKKGDEVDVGGQKAKVEEGASTSEGTKYNITLGRRYEVEWG